MTIDPKFVAMIKRGNFVVVDVETTGKEHYDIICEIAIINAVGETLLHTKINPLRPISAEATRIHGITDDDVKNAPTWFDKCGRVMQILEGKDVVIWNAKHEHMLFHRSDESAGISHIEWKNIGTWHCAMEFYAEVWGEPNEKYSNAKWQSLKNAMNQQGVEVGLFHSALEDVRMTLALCLFIATKPNEVRSFPRHVSPIKPLELTYDVKRILVQGGSDTVEICRLLSLGYHIEGVLQPISTESQSDILFPLVFLTRKFWLSAKQNKYVSAPKPPYFLSWGR